MQVSVILSVYNNARSVRYAVESIIGQTFTDWQLLIIDDGSTDGTSDELNALRSLDRRIAIYKNPGNLGLPASLNRAWQMTSAPLIARMDADDVCLPNRLEKQVAFMRSREDIDVLGTGVIVCRANSEESIWLRPERHVDLTARIYSENPFFHPTVIMRREFLIALGGYDEQQRRAQDYDLWLRGYRSFQYHNLQEPLVRYSAPARPKMSSLWFNSKALYRAVRRDGRPLAGCFYLSRLLVSGVLAVSGMKIRKRLKGT